MSTYICVRCGQPFTSDLRLSGPVFCGFCLDDSLPTRNPHWWESPQTSADVAPDEHLRRLGAPRLEGFD